MKCRYDYFEKCLINVGFILGYEDMGEYLCGWYELFDLEMYLGGFLK